MAIRWIEGFEEFGTTLNAAPQPTGIMGRKYTMGSEADVRIVTGRYAGLAIQLTTTACTVRPTSIVGWSTSNAKHGVGFAVQFSALAAWEFVTWYDNAIRGCNLRLTSTGNIAVYCADTLLGTTSGLNLLPGIWYYIEFYVSVAGTNGSFSLAINGNNWMTYNTQNTKGPCTDGYFTYIQFNGKDTFLLTIDDLYAYDAATGTTYTTYPQGVRQVTTLFPSSAGSSSQWTPSAGSNYACVNNAVCDDDGSYVTHPGTTGKIDYYIVPSTVNLVTDSIHGVQVNVDSRTTDGVGTKFAVKCTTYGSGQSGTYTITTTSYMTTPVLYETNPQTGGAWTANSLSNYPFGLISE